MGCKAGKEYDLWVVHPHPVPAGNKPWRYLLVPAPAIAHFKRIIQTIRRPRELMAQIDVRHPSWAAAEGEERHG